MCIQNGGADAIASAPRPSRGGIRCSVARRALGKGVADLREELDLVGDLGLGSLVRSLLAAGVEGVHGHHDAEVDREGHEDEVDDGGDQQAELQVATVQGEDEGVREIGLADDGRDQRVDDAVDQGVDDVLEGGTDDDTDGELDDVAARDEFLESLEHGYSCNEWGRPSRQV